MTEMYPGLIKLTKKIKHGDFMFEVIKIIFFWTIYLLQILLSDLIETRKQNYHFCFTEKLRDPSTSPKASDRYWKHF